MRSLILALVIALSPAAYAADAEGTHRYLGLLIEALHQSVNAPPVDVTADPSEDPISFLRLTHVERTPESLLLAITRLVLSTCF